MKRTISVAILAAALVSTAVYAQKPKVNVGSKHPNIAAAQKLTQQAWDRIVAAQKANEWDLNGHAQKAKDLLEQASKELKLAAQTANGK